MRIRTALLAGYRFSQATPADDPAAALAGDGYVAVHGGRVAERGEHAGGQVGAGDGESVRQVAVDRGPVGAGRGLAVQRGRAEDRPVQVAGPDLVLAAAHV